MSSIKGLLAIRAIRAGFAYTDAVHVFSDASFVVPRGWTGVVGENGAGKSTLLRVIAGELAVSEGALSIEPEWAEINVCEQRVDDASDALLLLAAATDARAQKLRAQLHLVPENLTRFPTLSPGERKRWQIAAALHAEPELLLLDEPTNHLDANARRWLLAALREFRGVGLIVSHDRALLDALTETTLRLHAGTVRAWSGNYSKARALWEAEQNERIEQRKQRQGEHKRQQALLDQIRRAEAGATKLRSRKHRMRNANDNDGRSIMVSTQAEWSQKSLGKRIAATQRHTEWASEAADAIQIEKQLGRSVFVSHERTHKAWLLSLDASLVLPNGTRIEVPAVSRDARIWLRGENGAGKTTLLKALLEHSRLPADRVLYLPQTTSEAEDHEALEHVRTLSPDSRGQVLSIVAALGVDPDRLLASHQPSPGEARKLMIARGLSEQRWILVLDEPENHLDLPSIERLERALAAYPGALLLVSHDAALARQVTTEHWTITDDGLHTRALEPPS